MENDRRKNVRVRVDVQGEVDLGDRSYPALMLNVSMGGCLIETSARPRIREMVILKIRRGLSMDEIKLKVVWQSYGKGLGKIGTQFYGMEVSEVRAMIGRILASASEHVDARGLDG